MSVNRNLWIAASAVFLASCVNAYAGKIPLKLATQAAQAALDSCKGNGYDVTITVLDADGSTRVVLRDDRAPEGSVQIAYRKAYTVIKSGMSSGDFGKSVPPVPLPAPGTAPGAVNGDPNLIPWGGGLPIKIGNVTVAAMSASGAPSGEKDEACVRAGIAAIGDRLK